MTGFLPTSRRPVYCLVISVHVLARLCTCSAALCTYRCPRFAARCLRHLLCVCRLSWVTCARRGVNSRRSRKPRELYSVWTWLSTKTDVVKYFLVDVVELTEAVWRAGSWEHFRLPAVTCEVVCVHNQPSSPWSEVGPVVAELTRQSRRECATCGTPASQSLVATSAVPRRRRLQGWCRRSRTLWGRTDVEAESTTVRWPRGRPPAVAGDLPRATGESVLCFMLLLLCCV